MSARRPSCRYCCRGCSRHFTSLAAFDLHLSWEDGADRDGWAPRLHLRPADLEGALRPRAGVCRISGHDDLDVDLLELAADAERARARFSPSAVRGKRQAPIPAAA